MKIKTHTPTGLRYACIEGYQYGTLVSNDHPDYLELNSNLMYLRKEGWCI